MQKDLAARYAGRPDQALYYGARELGHNVKVEDLRRDFDAIVLCGGSTAPRDLPIPGRELGGIRAENGAIVVGSTLVNAVKNSLDRKGKATSRTVKAVTDVKPARVGDDQLRA